MVKTIPKQFFLFLTLLFFYPFAGATAQNLNEDFTTWTTKGRDFVGLSFSVAHQEGENVQRLLVTDKELYTLDWSVRFYGGHFIKKNMTLGTMFEWKQSNGNSTYDYDGKTYRSDFFARGFLVGPTFRSYIPISKSNRFSLFNEVNLLFGYTKSLDQLDDGSEISRGKMETYSFSLGITPGMNVFIAEGWAVEASIELLGLETSVQNGEIDGVESHTVSNTVNFKINLLQLKLGITKYF